MKSFCLFIYFSECDFISREIFQSLLRILNSYKVTDIGLGSDFRLKLRFRVRIISRMRVNVKKRVRFRTRFSVLGLEFEV